MTTFYSYHVITARLALLSFILFTAACSMSPITKAGPSEMEELPQYWLTTSLYAGAAYGPKMPLLLDHLPLNRLAQKSSIIPAGTRVKVLKISPPNDANTPLKPLILPQFLVFFKVARERGEVSFFREETYVMALPQAVSNKKQLNSHLSKFLSHKDPNLWILQQESHVKNGIFEKHPIIGMNKEQVLAALGPASKRQLSDQDESHKEIWHYPHYLLVLEDEVVTKVKKL